MERLREALRSRAGEIRLASRMTIAAGLGFGIAHLLQLPQGAWVAITAMIVMQTSLGGSLKAAGDRMMGTLAGAVWGGLISVLAAHRGDAVGVVAILAAVAPTALLAAFRASFRVAPITALIVLLPAGVVTVSPLAYALERIVEIGLGIVVGVAVARFVLPAQARNLMKASAAGIASLNADLVEALIGALLNGEGRPGLAGLHARIRAGLRQMDLALEESLRERRAHLSNHADPEPLARTLYRVRHDLVMIGRACATPLPPEVAAALGEGLSELRSQVAHILRATAAALRETQAGPSADAYKTGLADYTRAMDRLRETGAMRHLPGVEVGRIYALRFGFEQLGKDLEDLVARVEDLRGS